MDIDSELRTLRRRQADLAARRDHRPGYVVMPGPVRAVQVFAETAVPTTVPRYFACHPLVTGGVEGEGQALVATPDTAQTLYVAVLGPRVPVAGDRLIARLVGPRWVADSGKSSAPPPGGCNGSLVPTSFNATLPTAVRLTPNTITTVLTYGPPPSGASAVWSRDVLNSGQCFAARLVTMPPSAWFSPAFPDPNTSGLGRMYYIYFYITGCAPTFKYLFYLPDATSLPSPWNICDDWGGQRSGGAVPFPQPVSWSAFAMTDCHQGLAADSRYVVSGIGNGTMPLDATGSLGKFT